MKHRAPDQPTPNEQIQGFLQKVTYNNVRDSNFGPTNSLRFGQNNGFIIVRGLKFHCVFTTGALPVAIVNDRHHQKGTSHKTNQFLTPGTLKNAVLKLEKNLINKLNRHECKHLFPFYLF